MKVGVIIPDRGDRPEFLKNCLRMMKAQTHKVDTLVVDHPPESILADITQRYRMGYERMSVDAKIIGEEYDILAFIENDDWYSPKYIETMLQGWEDHGKPDLFGTAYTIYFHLGLNKYLRAEHKQRSCSMNTFIKPRMNFVWPPDSEPYTDAWLWQIPEFSKRLWEPEIISIAMKHGVGKLGGRMHIDRLHRYVLDGTGFLEQYLDEESLTFYKSISDKLKKQ